MVGPYWDYAGKVKPRLQELGIRYVRDGGNSSSIVNGLNDLNTTLGIKSTLVMSPVDSVDANGSVAMIKSVKNSVVAIEGPNEWDLFDFRQGGYNFPMNLQYFQNQLYRAVKSDAETKFVEVLTPSIAMSDNIHKVGDMSTVADGGNIHSYPGGNRPDQDMDSKWLPEARMMMANKPITCTETGYHTAVNVNDSHKPLSEVIMSQTPWKLRVTALGIV